MRATQADVHGGPANLDLAAQKLIILPGFALMLHEFAHQLAEYLRRRSVNGHGHELGAQIGFELHCENGFFQ